MARGCGQMADKAQGEAAQPLASYPHSPQVP